MHVFLVGVCQQKGYPPNGVDIFTTMMINLKLETSLQSHRIPRSIEFPHGWTCILTPTIKSGDEGKRENLLKGRSNPTISHHFFSMVGNGDRWGSTKNGNIRFHKDWDRRISSLHNVSETALDWSFLDATLWPHPICAVSKMIGR